MKKLLAFILAAAMLMSLSACGEQPTDDPTTAPNETTVPTETTEPTEAASPDPTNPPGYDGIPIMIARNHDDGTEVTVSGVVAKITYSYGMKPSGFILADHTASIYVYGADAAAQVKEGNTVTLSGTRTWWILEDEQHNAEEFGYLGCSQLANPTIIRNDNGTSPIPTGWVAETTVKAIMDTPVFKDITTQIFKVTALICKAEGKGFTNYYINDLDGATGSYCYTQCNGKDFSWLDEFDGKICTVYLVALNAKSSSSGCIWRFLPIQVIDENFDISTVNIPKHVVDYFGIPQLQSTYTGDPALEMLTSVDSTVLNFTGASLSYTSDNESVVSIENGVLHCKAAGTAMITITGSYGGKTYSQGFTITVEENEAVDHINVQAAINTPVEETVTVKGIVGPSLVNRTGFYLIDDSGIIAVTTDEATMKTLNIGDEVILTGLRDKFHNGKGNHAGQTAITGCKVVSNHYGTHNYCTDFFVTDKTLADIRNLDVSVDYSTTVFVLKATVEVVETNFYSKIQLKDGATTVSLYCSSANQYSWLKEFAGQEVTLELAPCNWNNKSYWAGCVLAVYTDNGKIVNALNFG